MWLIAPAGRTASSSSSGQVRVFTSTNTKTSPSLKTKSISPPAAEKLEVRYFIPRVERCFFAYCSPRLPIKRCCGNGGFCFRNFLSHEKLIYTLKRQLSLLLEMNECLSMNGANAKFTEPLFVLSCRISLVTLKTIIRPSLGMLDH